jgi:hypothetical protein
MTNEKNVQTEAVKIDGAIVNGKVELSQCTLSKISGAGTESRIANPTDSFVAVNAPFAPTK